MEIRVKETRLIQIKQITIDQGIYPRRSTNQDKVDDYLDRLSYSTPPAIKVAPLGDGRFLLIDGNHRLQAKQKANTDDILADILDVNGKETLKMDTLALRYNLDHGLCVEPEMIRNKAIYYSSEGMSTKEIADLLKRSQRTVQIWVKSSKKKREEEKQQKVLKLLNEGKKHGDVAATLSVSKRTVYNLEKRAYERNESASFLSQAATKPNDNKDDSEPSINNDGKRLNDLLNNEFIPAIHLLLQFLNNMPAKINRASKDNSADKDALRQILTSLNKESICFKLIQELQIKMLLTDQSIVKALDKTYDPVEDLLNWYKNLFDNITDLKTCRDAIKSIFLQAQKQCDNNTSIMKEIKDTYLYYVSANTAKMPSRYHIAFIGGRTITELSRYYDTVRMLSATPQLSIKSVANLA